MRTVKYKNNRMDIGGHRFFSKEQRVMKWWKDLMPIQGAPAYDDKKLNRKKFFDYPVSMKPQTFINMGLVQIIKAGFSYLFSCFERYVF